MISFDENSNENWNSNELFKSDETLEMAEKLINESSKDPQILISTNFTNTYTEFSIQAVKRNDCKSI